MKQQGITRVSIKPGEVPPRGKTDWAQVSALTEDEILAAALADPDAQPLGERELALMRRVSRVKVLRERLGMTQTAFAEAFEIPVSTLRDWEQHRCTPDSPAGAAEGDRARARNNASPAGKRSLSFKHCSIEDAQKLETSGQRRISVLTANAAAFEGGARSDSLLHFGCVPTERAMLSAS